MSTDPANNQRSSQTADVLIVGQGIAGSLLGWVLHQRGLRVRIVDDGHKTSASVVAAGMINPVQGKRLNTLWEIENCLPAAAALYRELEAHFQKRFFFPKKIVRLLKDPEQAAILQTRLTDPAFAPYLGAVHPPEDCHAIASISNATDANCPHAPCGSVEITGGGYLDTQSLLSSLRDFFRSKGILVERLFAHPDLDLSEPHSVRWQGYAAQRIVFAEGWRILDNPFFAGYRFIPTKGQILSVQSARPLPDYVLNRGTWLVPQAEREAWIGATFERGQTDAATTPEAAREILSDVQSFIPANPLRVLGQRAGVRLAAPDHIPRIGFLPAEPRIGIFSAFSSKGNCLAPYLANCMAEHILHGTALPVRTDIAVKKTGR